MIPNPQLYPLEINPTTGEPFLRLQKHSNIIITPPRLEDAPAYLSPLNDPRVCDWLAGPPYPYTIDHANQFASRIKSVCDAILKQLQDAKDEPTPVVVGQSPVRVLRELQENGSDVFLGDIGLMRCMHGELMPDAKQAVWENKAQKEAENNQLAPGDPDIIWSIGDFLIPSHHGRGIMTDAVYTILQLWAIPRMAVRHMWVSAEIGNEGSIKVFKKNGFKVIGKFEEHHVVKGRMRGLVLLEWRYGNVE